MPHRSVSSPREERLEAILESLIAEESTSPQQLAARFGVSLMTVHRDLDELQARGLVRKFRGGADVARTGNFEIAAALRRRIAVPQKRAIAAVAARLVSPGQAVLLDDSTTVAHLVPHLLEVEKVHVITNYLPTLALLAERGVVEFTAIGGRYDVGHESFLDTGAAAAVRALRVDTTFLSTSTADRHGIYHQEDKIVAVKAEMLRSASRRVLLLDSTKIPHTSLHRVADWDVVDDLVTDDRAPGDLLEALRERGVTVHVADVPAHDRE